MEVCDQYQIPSFSLQHDRGRVVVVFDRGQELVDGGLADEEQAERARLRGPRRIQAQQNAQGGAPGKLNPVLEPLDSETIPRH